VIVRDALPAELPAVGELRVAAYVAGGFMSETSGYAPRLRGLGANGEGSVLVAVTEDADADRRDPGGTPGPAGPLDRGAPAQGGGRVVGTIMLQTSPQAGEIVNGPGEAEIRALAVAPGVRGRGVGRALLRAVLDRAAGHGTRHLVLLTQPEMAAARRLYEREGFRRLPERDWTPEPGIVLIAYGLRLDGGPG
jgi:ribosomal protein S18 acetylase RimI-like enzyme